MSRIDLRDLQSSVATGPWPVALSNGPQRHGYSALTACFKHGESFAAFAIEVKENAAFWIGFVQRFAEGLHVRDGFAVHFRNDIFALDVLGSSDAVILHVCYDHTFVHWEMQTFRNVFRQFLHLQAKLADTFLRRLPRLSRQRI